LEIRYSVLIIGYFYFGKNTKLTNAKAFILAFVF